MKNEITCQWILNENSQLVCSQCLYVLQIKNKVLSSLPKRNCPKYQARHKLCIHLGEHIRDQQCGQCKNKKGFVRSIMECQIFGECTVNLPKINNIQCCSSCDKYEV